MKAKALVKDASKSDLDTMQELMIHKRDKQQSHGHLMDMDTDLNANEADGSYIVYKKCQGKGHYHKNVLQRLQGQRVEILANSI